MSSKFEIFEGSNHQYYWRLRARNYQIILASEGYVSKSGCKNGIASAIANAPYEHAFRRLTAINGLPYFTLNATNGQVIGVSETYSSAQARDAGIAAVKSEAPTATVFDLSLESNFG
ncbi:hypothetical protein GCM10011369_19100 [Neiella marina]|uniref:DUF1508 domain-containing protein n=1 Tax=Neiella marina TaxID=508461 RepID=A0A8J2XPJ9_9GAMM|nr:YegP family protein [Neiella marina]GGA77398.1 hypothetical protein GCM10011369_19100 [Neiella marina]